MSTHKKDLEIREPIRGHDVVVQLDEPGLAPVLRAIFVDGKEILLPSYDPGVTVEMGTNDLTTITLSLIASSVEVIYDEDAKERTFVADPRTQSHKP